ncbi:hypothetical protein [Dongshaea marina]|uniref:hypothetical protein n=1 Tax=Dongshaea marina TaxID=2047966 RepID=UPI001F454950|nr:hypothetical protein [Dongshaea marina]
MSPKTIYQITSDNAEPRLSTIKPLIVQLGCTADEIIFDDDELKLPTELQMILKNITQLPDEKQEIVKEMLKGWVTYQLTQEMNKK